MEHYALRPTKAFCPVCSCPDGLILYSAESEQAAQHYVVREVEPDRHRLLREHLERLWRQATCDVVRCAQCGFCFADPFVAGDARFYELACRRTGYPQRRWEFSRTRASLVAFKQDGLLEDARLLEIGAGNGAFVKQVAPALVAKENVVCTEYSEYGNRAITDYGVRCIPQDVRALSADGEAGRFDVICMFQVLEHLDRLDELFAHLSSLSRDTAHLFVSVPNGKRIEFNELHGSILDMPPNHIGRWTRGTFDAVARRHGWSVVELEIEPESVRSKARQFALYHYGRKRQDARSIANRIERIRPKPARRVLQLFAVLGYSLAAMPQFLTLCRDPELGETQWVHLTKEGAPQQGN